jgi:transcriptional regulator with XRE-family HTH domain
MRLRNKRESLGLNQSDVAKAIGVSTGAYQNYEYGKEISSGRILQICAVLKCSPNWLLGVSEEGACLHEDSLLLRQLRMAFDELNAEGQKKVVDYARDLSSIPSYTETGEKEPSSSTNVS